MAYKKAGNRKATGHFWCRGNVTLGLAHKSVMIKKIYDNPDNYGWMGHKKPYPKCPICKSNTEVILADYSLGKFA